MKLNHDCVRALLLTCENEIPFNETARASQLKDSSLMAIYDLNEIIYAASKLLEAGYIDAAKIEISGQVLDLNIYEITWSGHEFLDNVRDNKVWKEIKEQTSILKSVSISIISELGIRAVKKFLHLD